MSTVSAIACEASQDALPVCLWRSTENPYRLVSLLDIMKGFAARDLLFTARELRNTAGLIFESKNGPGYKQAAIETFGRTIRTLMELCRSLDLPMSSLHASQMLESIECVTGSSGYMFDSSNAERVATMLSVTLENELSLRLFFEVPPDKAKLYSDNNAAPFGDSVAVAFPSVSFDAGEANRCIALSRNTACVFHLMRVLEIGLSVLAKQFNVAHEHRNWENVIGDITAAIGRIDQQPNRPSTWRDDREFYSQCASHFRIFKDAWRNYTAHARGKYDEQEALDLIGNVRSFMQKLATRLHE